MLLDSAEVLVHVFETMTMPAWPSVLVQALAPYLSFDELGEEDVSAFEELLESPSQEDIKLLCQRAWRRAMQGALRESDRRVIALVFEQAGLGELGIEVQ